MAINNVPRSTLTFRSEKLRDFYKSLYSDLAVEINGSAADVAIKLAIDSLASTDEGVGLLKRTYYYDYSVLEQYEGAFDDLAALGPLGRDERPLFVAFARYVRHHSLRLNCLNERVHHFRQQWESVCTILTDRENEGLEQKLQAKYAKEMLEIISLDNTASVDAKSFISILSECWETLRNYSSTYRALVDITVMSEPLHPERHGHSSRDRLNAIRVVDAFYASSSDRR